MRCKRFQDAIFEGLLGLAILEPGCARLRVSPNVPAAWKSWHALVPLPHGSLRLVQIDGRLNISVTDPRVKVIEAPASATVRGARRAALSPQELSSSAALSAPTPPLVPALKSRAAALLWEDGIPTGAFGGLPLRRISADELTKLDPADIAALVIAGNAVPSRTKSGVDIREPLARYLDRGGAIVFYGATMHDRDTMGEHGGVIDWYEFRPQIHYTPIGDWKFRGSPADPEVEREQEYGSIHNWHSAGPDDPGWIDLNVPQIWQDHPPNQWHGWEWFRADFRLPRAGAGPADGADARTSQPL